MLIDFRKIFSGALQPVSKQVLFEYENDDFNGFTVEEPVLCDIKLDNESANAKLYIKIKVSVIASCARCLDDVKEHFEFECTYFIKNNEWTVDDPNGNNLPFTNDGKLSIKELAFSEIMLGVPQIMLCSEDCTGLCPNCGKRKGSNSESDDNCDCETVNSCEETTEIDERLSALKQLLID